MRFWIHVKEDIAEERRKRLTEGDRIAFYLPRPHQEFSAIGAVLEGGHIELTRGAAPIQPLIESLEFVRDKHQWGWVFRRGFFEIGEADFQRIAAALSAESSLLAAAP